MLLQVIRQLIRGGATTVLTVVGLGLVLGTAASAFLLLDAVFLRPPPFPAADELFVFGRPGSSPGFMMPLAWDQLADAAQHKSLRATAGFVRHAGTFSHRFARAEQLTTTGITADFFSTLAIAPRIGSAAVVPPVEGDLPRVFISDELWRSRFAADERIVESTVTLGGRDVVVQGVMPTGFDFPHGTNVWVGTSEPRRMREMPYLTGLARLHSGTTQWQVPELHAQRVREYLRLYDDGSVALIAMTMAGLVLISLLHLAGTRISADVAGIGAAAICLALGATRRQLVARASLTGIVVSAAAALVAFALLHVITAVLVRYLPPELVSRSFDVDARVGAFLALSTAFLVAAASSGTALLLTRVQPDVLLQSRRGAVAGVPLTRTRNLVLLCQAAGVSAILYVSLLALASLAATVSRPLGFEPAGVVSVELPGDLPRGTGETVATSILRELRARSGVTTAAAGPIPLSPDRVPVNVRLTPPLSAADLETQIADERRVTAGFFTTMGIPIVAGRDFDDRDLPRQAVVLSESVSRHLAQSADSLVGVTAYVGGISMRVVGIAGDVYGAGPERPVSTSVYVLSRTGDAILARTSLPAGDALGLVSAVIRQYTGATGPLLSVDVQAQASQATARQRGRSALLSFSAAAALALVCATVAFQALETVRWRRREIAIKLALGAHARKVTQEVAARSLGPVLAGTCLGLIAGTLLARATAALYIGFSPANLTVSVLVVTAVVTASVMAMWFALRRALEGSLISALKES